MFQVIPAKQGQTMKTWWWYDDDDFIIDYSGFNERKKYITNIKFLYESKRRMKVHVIFIFIEIIKPKPQFFFNLIVS